jgi:predicted GTPase
VSIPNFATKFSKVIHVEHTTTHNIVIFGQTGAGKSSIINMLAGKPVAEVSECASGCTSSNKRYSIRIGTANLHVLGHPWSE